MWVDCASCHCPGLRAHRWKWKASSFLTSPVTLQESPEAPTGEWKWLCASPSKKTFQHTLALISNGKHYFSLVLLLIRPGSASPSGKPSGPGGPVGPLPTHFAPQVSIFLKKFVCWDVLKDLCLLPFFFEHLKVCQDVKAAVQQCTAPMSLSRAQLYFLLNMQNVMKETSSRALILW